MTDWLKEALAIEDELIDIRRKIHRHPEIADNEYETIALLSKELESLGIEVHRYLDTAAVGILKGAYPGPTAALRTDLDALPVQENTGLPYASEIDGVMHACGHDIHMAALMGAAKLLAAHRDELHGNIAFLLQPAEENTGGAKRMIEAGALEGIDAVFGAHVNPELKPGQIGIKYGRFYAVSTRFNITVHGRGCHGAEPEKGIDPLYAACRMCAALKELTGCHNNKRDIVSIGTIHAGTVRNIIPDSAYFCGILRTMGFENTDMMTERIRQEIRKIEEETGVWTDVDIYFAYPGIENHDEETALAEETARSLFPEEDVIVFDTGTMTSEDFGFFLLERPGCFYHIGVGGPAGLHSPQFCPDESAIAKGAAMHAAVLSAYLEKHR